MKLKILFVIDALEFGGGERVFTQIINGFPAERFEIHLAAGHHTALKHAITGLPVKFYSLNFSNRYNPAAILRLISIMKEHQINIVHGQGARAEFFARLAARLYGRCQYISTIAMPVESFDVNPAKKIIYRLMDRCSEQFVDKFIVVSSKLQQIMVESHGIMPNKVTKIYNGIETDYFMPIALEEQRAHIRETFALNERVSLIGCLGRLVWQKGFEYFIRSIPALLQNIQDVKFILVGDGPLRGRLEALSKSLGIEDRLIFTGHRNDIRDIISAIDIVVIPSLLEGFPMITLEAMAMEKPIIATAIDGIFEQIANNEEGILIAPQNPMAIALAVEQLLLYPCDAQRIGKNARERVIRDFSVKKMIEETIKVYEA
jgi:glycosyltransferase involved in cell wall biosynthesis